MTDQRDRDAAHKYRLLQAQALIDSCAKAGTGQRPRRGSTRHGDGANAAGTRGQATPPSPPKGAGLESTLSSPAQKSCGESHFTFSHSDLHGASCISRRV